MFWNWPRPTIFSGSIACITFWGREDLEEGRSPHTTKDGLAAGITGCHGRYGRSKTFQELEIPHAQVHKLAGDIVGPRSQGQGRAYNLFAQLQKLQQPSQI